MRLNGTCILSSMHAADASSVLWVLDPSDDLDKTFQAVDSSYVTLIYAWGQLKSMGEETPRVRGAATAHNDNEAGNIDIGEDFEELSMARTLYEDYGSETIKLSELFDFYCRSADDPEEGEYSALCNLYVHVSPFFSNEDIAWHIGGGTDYFEACKSLGIPPDSPKPFQKHYHVMVDDYDPDEDMLILYLLR